MSIVSAIPWPERVTFWWNDVFCFVLDQHSWIFIVLAHWNNSPWVNMLLLLDTLFWLWTNQSLLSAVCLAEKQQIPISVFGLTQIGIKRTIYRTRDEHTNHYTTNAVHWIFTLPSCVYWQSDCCLQPTQFSSYIMVRTS